MNDKIITNNFCYYNNLSNQDISLTNYNNSINYKSNQKDNDNDKANKKIWWIYRCKGNRIK